MDGVRSVRSEGVVVQSLSRVLFLCDPMDRSLPGSSVHGDFSGKNAGVGCHFLRQGTFLDQGSNPCLLHWQADSLPLSQQGSQGVEQKSQLRSSVSSTRAEGRPWEGRNGRERLGLGKQKGQSGP